MRSCATSGSTCAAAGPQEASDASRHLHWAARIYKWCIEGSARRTTRSPGARLSQLSCCSEAAAGYSFTKRGARRPAIRRTLHARLSAVAFNASASCSNASGPPEAKEACAWIASLRPVPGARSVGRAYGWDSSPALMHLLRAAIVRTPSQALLDVRCRAGVCAGSGCDGGSCLWTAEGSSDSGRKRHQKRAPL